LPIDSHLDINRIVYKEAIENKAVGSFINKGGKNKHGLAREAMKHATTYAIQCKTEIGSQDATRRTIEERRCIDELPRRKSPKNVTFEKLLGVKVTTPRPQ
jgi:hypothetical protein